MHFIIFSWENQCWVLEVGGILGPVGRLIWREERGRGGSDLAYYGGLSVVTTTVYAPPNMGEWRKARRMKKAAQAFGQAGVRQVIWADNCPWTARQVGFSLIPVEGMYQGMADRLALAALEGLGCSPQQGRVALVGQRLTLPLQRTAQRLCPQVRGLLIQVPGQGEDYARWLHGQYGLPVAPAAAGADVTVAFSSRGPRWGRCLELYEGCDLDGLRLDCPGLELPPDIWQELLAVLWERGAVTRDQLTVVEGESRP